MRDGTYRVVAGRLIPGKILGGFLYAGTRPDDPNDVVPHEHRRELRALRVFGAWTNLTDLKAANTLDALVTENGRSIVKHYLQDVGSTFGMCNDLHEWDLSWEYFYQGDTTRRRLFSLRLCAEPVADGRLRRVPVDRQVRGRSLRSQNVAAADADDGLSGVARRRRVLGRATGRGIHRRLDQGGGPHRSSSATRRRRNTSADVLIKRRDKIASIYLTAVNPIVDPRLDANGRLTFDNAAVAAGVASGAGHLPRRLDPLRQRDGRDASPVRHAEPDDNHRGAARLADRVRQFRRGGHLRRQRRTPDVAAADPHLFRRGAKAGRSWGSNGCP